MTVEGLEGFPFPSFRAYQVACEIGAAQLGINPEMGISFLLSGKCGRARRALAWATLIAPWGVTFYFSVYAITHNAWLLLGMPLLIVSFIASHPAMATLRKSLRPLFLGGLILVIVLCWFALIHGHHTGLLILGMSILMIFAAHLTLLKIAMGGISHKAIANEDFLCELWTSNAVNVATVDGDRFSQWKARFLQGKAD